MADWDSFIKKVRDDNFQLATCVTQYEGCVAVQGTAREDVQARVTHAKKREETRKMVVTLQEGLITHMNEGSQDSKKSVFFTECYNFTSCVERFKKALEKSVRKEQKRLQMNTAELEKIRNSDRLSEEEKKEALSQAEEVDQITREKARQINAIKDAMSGLVAQLRSQAKTDVESGMPAGMAGDDNDEDEELGLGRKKVPWIMFLVLFFVAIIAGSIKWYVIFAKPSGR